MQLVSNINWTQDQLDIIYNYKADIDQIKNFDDLWEFSHYTQTSKFSNKLIENEVHPETFYITRGIILGIALNLSISGIYNDFKVYLSINRTIYSDFNGFFYFGNDFNDSLWGNSKKVIRLFFGHGIYLGKLTDFGRDEIKRVEKMKNLAFNKLKDLQINTSRQSVKNFVSLLDLAIQKFDLQVLFYK